MKNFKHFFLITLTILITSWTTFGQYTIPIAGFPSTGNYYDFGSGGNHNGIDIPAAVGTPVYAVRDGYVIYSKEASGFGSLNPNSDGGVVIVRHQTNTGAYFYAVYGHLYRSTSYNGSGSPGQYVSRGQQLGTIRPFKNGTSSLPHLHFGIYTGSSFPSSGWGYSSLTNWVNPEPYLNTYCGTPAAKPTLYTPAANATNLTGSINFTWSATGSECRIQIIDAANYSGFSTSTGFSGTMAFNANLGNQTSFKWVSPPVGRKFYWTVRANNAAGTSGFASYRTFTTATSTGSTCNFPTTLYYSNLTKSAATFWWSSVTSALSYTVQYRLQSSSSYYNLGTFSAKNANPYNSVNVSGLSPSTCYVYRVISNCNSGSSLASNTMTLCTPSSFVNNDDVGQIMAVQTDENISTIILPETGLLNRGVAVLKIAPNPSLGSFNISYSAVESEKEAAIAIFDLSGRTIFSNNIVLNTGENDIKISIGNLSRGMYLLKFITKKAASTSNLIIE
jgi:hypothetical protein